MLNRLVPLIALFCIFVVAVISYIQWRLAEKEEETGTAVQPSAMSDAAGSSPLRGSREKTLAAESQAELYARRAEAAAERVEAAAKRIEDAVSRMEDKLRPQPTGSTGSQH